MFSFLSCFSCFAVSGPKARSGRASSHLRRHRGLGDTDWGSELRHRTWLSVSAQSRVLAATHNRCLIISHHEATIVAFFHVGVVAYATVGLFSRLAAFLDSGLEERGELDALVLTTLLHLLLNALYSIVV